VYFSLALDVQKITLYVGIFICYLVSYGIRSCPPANQILRKVPAVRENIYQACCIHIPTISNRNTASLRNCYVEETAAPVITGSWKLVW